MIILQCIVENEKNKNKRKMSFSHAATETSSSYLNKIPEISSCLRAAGGGAGGRNLGGWEALAPLPNLLSIYKVFWNFSKSKFRYLL